MLPATLAHEVKKQILHYLGATFNFRDSDVESALGRFMNDPESGIFKGPWVEVQLPFKPAGSDGRRFFDLKVPFMPFRHQWLAWERLSAKSGHPEPTIVTTGTGSGKTECFLFPILDYCLRMHNSGFRDGIKAIVLYPMNALAADQAGRFAEEILTSDQLSVDTMVNGILQRKALIRAGLYTGRMPSGNKDPSGGETGTYKALQRIDSKQPDGRPTYTAITSRQAMQDDPPDILLTNYKMLDYLLMRPKDRHIWRHNQKNPGLLKYLVLDELHTYDGAQGADVACLIRRLKERLNCPAESLCVVGTSATIASSSDETTDDPIDRLCKFAETLFEENIPNDAVIQEERFGVAEIVRQPGDAAIPDPQICEPGVRETAEDYARRMSPLFGGPAYPVSSDDLLFPGIHVPDSADADQRWRLALGEWIRTHPLFHEVLRLANDGAIHWSDLVRRLSRDVFRFREVGGFDARQHVLMAFLALVARARQVRSGRVYPLVPTRVQFWVRELRRIGRLVSPEPVFAWLDEPPVGKRVLPTVHCTECGESSWVAVHDPDRDSIIRQKGSGGFALRDDPGTIYQTWGFERSPAPGLVILSPYRQDDAAHSADIQPVFDAVRYYLSPDELVVRIGPGPCPVSDGRTFPVNLVRETRRNESDNRLFSVIRCPHCNALDTLMFIGSRAATMASVAIDEVFGSMLNNDPKLLAFTDSVQDASHRAGFFSARTYHFTFRTALQHVIDAAGSDGVPMDAAGDRLVDHWSSDLPGRPGSVRETMATLMPPDLRKYAPYLEFRNNSAAQSPKPELLREFIERLNWEAASEFSLMLTHGRTLELHGGACLGWDETVIEETARRISSRMPGISPLLERITHTDIKRWIYGIVHRQRQRGGLYHPYLDSYARQNYWGKYPFNRIIQGRETFPPHGKYRPRLLTTAPDRYHDFILAPGGSGRQLPWQLVWLRRVMDVPGVDESSLIDLIRLFLETADQTGLMKCLHVDGPKAIYALNCRAARLYPEGVKLVCSKSGHVMYRPKGEARLWVNAPGLSYHHGSGVYQEVALNDRERYYRDRYRKGALRRVFAHEHTGLLTTGERESLELAFNMADHADDPNVLTATSTLEMGIDIGDLSTTMLCSIPPSTAGFLQRIGRAGRGTGTALILSVINQRPHDLFFFARPWELLKGWVEPPGCWLDASAVLVRQYLAYCFDQAVKQERLLDLPATGKQLVDEMIVNRSGHIPGLLEWMTLNEARLQADFMVRFKNDARQDTVDRFMNDTRTEKLRQRIETAAQEFDYQRNLIRNARRRLLEQKRKLDPVMENQAVKEIEQEQKILSARQRKLGEISALEVLIEHGLLPNYAFPERGVRFSGTTFNRHADRASKTDVSERFADQQTEKRLQPYELIRGAAASIRELAPGNHFYTRSHMFDIQQIEIGSASHPLVEEWAVCGRCGHMQPVDTVRNPQAVPYCPQCGYDGPQGQTDIGQHRAFLPFHRSQAVSYMEYYDSLSGDKGDDRENEAYQIAVSFDHTVSDVAGALGDDTLPFGIEYRQSVCMREINTGYHDQPADLAFGHDVQVPEGFDVCMGCGVVVPAGGYRSDVRHRKSCPGRYRTEQRRQEGRDRDAYAWQQIYLYRELRSEAIRLLLPDVEKADLDTLEASIYLGMRIRFQGDPAHLTVKSQVIPDHRQGLTRHYLVLMDAVPGGTGYLKTLFQETDARNRPGEGVMDVLRKALNALETCECRRMQQTDEISNGCYRCIRTYHMQYRSGNIESDRGIRILKDLIAAGERRSVIKALDDIHITAIFDSMLEKRFVEKLRQWVESIHGDWRETMIGGKRGYRFIMPGKSRSWSLELHPMLGPFQGVSVACQPDFLLTCDTPDVKPVAVFADGFEPHVCPEDPQSRLIDDIEKRRAILDSNTYRVWSVTWDDLKDAPEENELSWLLKPVIERVLEPAIKKIRSDGTRMPESRDIADNPWRQLIAFITCPDSGVWNQLAVHVAGTYMKALAIQGIGTSSQNMNVAFEQWRNGDAVRPLQKEDTGAWIWLNRVTLSDDLMAYAPINDLDSGKFENMHIGLRLDDRFEKRQKTGAYRERWRQFMAMMNFFQFTGKLIVFATSETEAGTAPELPMAYAAGLDPEWQNVLDETIPRLEPLVKSLSQAGRVVPETEYHDEALEDELFAELAWPENRPPIAFLAGDQGSFTGKWQQAGWTVITDADLQGRGIKWVVSQVPEAAVDYNGG